MNDLMMSAIEIAKAQATTKPMVADEIVSLVENIYQRLSNVELLETKQEPSIDPMKSIREGSVVCIECGKTMKVLTAKHLASHGLTPNEYREKWGLKKSVSLVAKSLGRARKKKMQDMRLWEKKTVKVGQQVGQQKFPKPIQKAPKAAETAETPI